MAATPLRRAPDPVRDPLAEVRRALLRLHKALIDSERARYEARRGPLTNTQLLGALLEDPFFQWLRPYSQLIAAMDEAIFSREPIPAGDARALVHRAHALLADAPEDGERRLDAATGRDAGARLAHAELTRRVAAALVAYGGAD